MESLVKQFEHNFDDGDFELYDKNKNMIYFENIDGFWSKRKYDDQNNEIYYEDSTGFWIKREYDKKGNQIYYENSDGLIIDNRAKKIITINGKKYQEI